MVPEQTMRRGSRSVSYGGQIGQMQHFPTCKVPHPFAIAECSCPASATLSTATPVEKLSVFQYDMMYDPVPLPRHKVLHIREKLRKLYPEDPRYFFQPGEQEELQAYKAELYGYDPEQLSPEQLQHMTDPNGVMNPQATTPQAQTDDRPFWEENMQQRPPGPQYPQPQYPPEPQYPTQRRSTAPAPYPQAQVQPNPNPNPNPIVLPAAEGQCRNSHLIEFIPGVLILVECQIDLSAQNYVTDQYNRQRYVPHPGLPHLAKLPSRQAGTDLRLCWYTEGD